MQVQKRLSRSALLLSFAATLACSVTALTPAGSAVKLIKADPPAGCEELGLVVGEAGDLEKEYEESARNRLRNKAGEKGANLVRLETYDGNNGAKYTGTAYACSKQPD